VAEGYNGSHDLVFFGTVTFGRSTFGLGLYLKSGFGLGRSDFGPYP